MLDEEREKRVNEWEWKMGKWSTVIAVGVNKAADGSLGDSARAEPQGVHLHGLLQVIEEARQSLDGDEHIWTGQELDSHKATRSAIDKKARQQLVVMRGKSERLRDRIM